MSLILDLFVASYTNYHSFFFLNVLNQKKIIYIIFVGLIIDFIIANTYGLITLTLIFLYFINLYLKNFYLTNLFNYFFILIIFHFKFTFVSLFLQIIFIYLTNRHIIKW